MSSATAVAHANIALAKYWGKLDAQSNLPSVPSLSMTLASLHTQTSVHFDDALPADTFVLEGAPQSGRELLRVSQLLDTVRSELGHGRCAVVESRNNFPTAAGLASSASGFAALALAARAAAGLDTSLGSVSALARASSASAARSVYGGYVVLESAGTAAVRFLPAEHYPLTMLVTVVTDQRKEAPSTSAMQHTAQTSPYYPAWLDQAPRTFEQMKSALQARDIMALGPAVEHSTLMMHACMLAAQPAVVYWKPATVRVMERVRQLRAQGLPVFFTMDAGPHVKVLTVPEHARQAEQALLDTPEVIRVITSGPGPDAHLVT